MHGIVPILLLLAACNPPPEAPEDLGELSKFLYLEWANEDPEVPGVGLLNLRDHLRGVDLDDDDVDDRSFLIGPIEEEYLTRVDIPQGRDPRDTVGVGVALESRWPVEDHARLQIEPDQVAWEPSAESYTRRFVNVDDPECFLDRSCVMIDTENDIRRQNLLISIDFVLHKEFQWFELPGEDQWAFMSRSWTDQVWEGENENSAVLQSYSVDVWLPSPNDEVCWRYQVLWSEVDIVGGSDTAVATTVKNSANAILEAGDDSIEDLYH